jgi:hypothetical protein
MYYEQYYKHCDYHNYRGEYETALRKQYFEFYRPFRAVRKAFFIVCVLRQNILETKKGKK